MTTNTAENATAGVPVVRGLVWEDADDGMCTKWRAAALGGNYELVAFDGEDGFAVNFHWGRPLSFWFIQGDPDEWGPTGPKMFPDLDEAKAAAQADYDQRILSSLNPDFLAALDTARAEIERLGFELGAAKKIIAACAGALPNGAFIDPERASMDFMEMLPDEIHAVCAGMSDEIAKLQQDRRKVHELSATLRDKSTWNLPIQEAAQEIVLLSSQLPDPNAEPTNATLSPVKEPK